MPRLPFSRMKKKKLAFIPVGKTNDSQTTTATTRRFVVLRSTTVLFWNSPDSGVVCSRSSRFLPHSGRHFSECLKPPRPILHFPRTPGKFIASHRALSINPHAPYPQATSRSVIMLQALRDRQNKGTYVLFPKVSEQSRI
jgi:hypothetical protein